MICSLFTSVLLLIVIPSAVTSRIRAAHDSQSVVEVDQNTSADYKVCKPWCNAMQYDADLGYGVYCNDPAGCSARTLMYDHMNILKYPTYTHDTGKDYTWQQMLLVRNGLCPRVLKTATCFVNPLGGGKSNRNERCGACVMDTDRKDIYLKALSGGSYKFDTIRNNLNGNRDNIVVFGMSAINKRYKDAEGIRRNFHHKRDMWAEFKRDCGFQCNSTVGLKFLPSTFDLNDAGDLRAFSQEFRPGAPYLAKNERDAKQGIKIFKAATAQQLLKDIEEEGRRLKTEWYVLQEMLDKPALAKVGDAPGFKVNMRTFLILTCSREQREWSMLRAGSYLHYSLAPYRSDIDPSDSKAFKAVVDTSYNVEDLVLKGYITRKDANKWPSSNTGFLENLREQGWTNDTEAEWRKIEAIFKKGAAVYDQIICNAQDRSILDGTRKMFYLIGADILMTGTEVDGHRHLQPYLIEWNSGPAFGDWGRSKDLEHKTLTLLAALRKGGILPEKPFIPLFTQSEYEHITPENFDEERSVWSTIEVKANPFST